VAASAIDLTVQVVPLKRREHHGPPLEEFERPGSSIARGMPGDEHRIMVRSKL
jgi:hypothetical protein